MLRLCAASPNLSIDNRFLAAEQSGNEASQIIAGIAKHRRRGHHWRLHRTLVFVGYLHRLLAPPLAHVAIWTIGTIAAASLPPGILARCPTSFGVAHGANRREICNKIKPIMMICCLHVTITMPEAQVATGARFAIPATALALGIAASLTAIVGVPDGTNGWCRRVRLRKLCRLDAGRLRHMQPWGRWQTRRWEEARRERRAQIQGCLHSRVHAVVGKASWQSANGDIRTDLSAIDGVRNGRRSTYSSGQCIHSLLALMDGRRRWRPRGGSRPPLEVPVAETIAWPQGAEHCHACLC